MANGDQTIVIVENAGIIVEISLGYIVDLIACCLGPGYEITFVLGIAGR
jgi:hypothetical protein